MMDCGRKVQYVVGRNYVLEVSIAIRLLNPELSHQPNSLQHLKCYFETMYVNSHSIMLQSKSLLLILQAPISRELQLGKISFKLHGIWYGVFHCLKCSWLKLIYRKVHIMSSDCHIVVCIYDQGHHHMIVKACQIQNMELDKSYWCSTVACCIFK